MLHIILLILKVIGIILAAILGLLVLLLLLMLFVPLRYTVTASFPGTLKDAQAEARISLLMHLISGKAVYKDQEFTYRFRAAWKKWDGDEGAEEAVREVEEPVEKGAEYAAETVEEDYTDDAEHAEEHAEEEHIEEARIKAEQAEAEYEAVDDSMEQEAPLLPGVKKTQKRRKRKPFAQFVYLKIKKLYKKILSLIARIKYTFLNFCAKIKALIRKREMLEKFINDETHKAAFAKAKKEVFRLLRYVKPRKFKANIHYGFEDPYLTGRTLAGLSMVYPFIGNNAVIRPDFEQAVLEGDLLIRGNLRMIYLVIPAWNLFWDKNVRRTYRHVRKLNL